jgi:hypothetical protein
VGGQPPLRLVTPPPPLARLVAPPLTHVEEVSSNDSPTDSSGNNDECLHVKEVISYEQLLDFNCLVQLLNVHVHFQIQKLEKKLVVAEKELQQARKDNQALTQYINAKRKKEDLQKKAEEEARKKAKEGQSFKDVRSWRK